MATVIVKQQEWSPLVTEMSAEYGIEPGKLIETLKRTVCPSNVTNEQLLAFLAVAKKYKLNPFTREIFAFPSPNGGIVPIVSVDGRVAMTQREEQYDGCEFTDHEKDGKLVAITCTIFRKDRSHPTVVTEYLSECKRNTEPWAKMERRMLRHKAFIQASRYAFGFSGLYDEDEAQDMAARVIPGRLEIEEPAPPAVSQPPAPAAAPAPAGSIQFFVGEDKTVITGEVNKLDMREMKPLGLKIEPYPPFIGRMWTIPAVSTEDFLQICEAKRLAATQIDEQGKKIFEAADEDLPQTMFEDGK